MPVCKILRKIQRGIERHKKGMGKTIVDSYIVNDTDVEQIKEDFIRNLKLTEELDDDNDTTMQYHSFDKDNPIKTFEEEDWEYHNGKWRPPEAKITKLNQQPEATEPAQSDSGANRIVTDNIKLLSDVMWIDDTPMSGCNKNDPEAIVCTAMGKMTLISETNETINVTAYYSPNVDGTIISPTTIVAQHKQHYYGWIQEVNYERKEGTITLLGKEGTDDMRLPVTCSNDLWYHSTSSVSMGDQAKVNRLSNAARYELWHQRTVHAGTNTLESLHKHANGVPPLKGNAFFRCPSCMSGKLATKQPIGKKKNINNTKPIDDDNDDIYIPNAEPGQHFHMDFGFVRGSDFNYKTQTGKTVTSIDGKNAYLAIIDRSSRYTWVFITDSKLPPVKEAQMVLSKFKSTNPHRTVRVDQGGELNSNAFKAMVAEEKFSIELTGSDSSAQNGMVENPNRTYGQMMRCALHSAELGPEYWSYALTHAVYVKNRITHHSIQCTPYEKFTGLKPNLANLKIFGSKVFAKNPGRRPYKLDHHTSGGYFLGYTATNKIYNYIDEKSGRVKTATHVIFDEAHMSTPANRAPLAAQTLQRLGYYAKEDWIKEVEKEEDEEEPIFLVQRLTTTAINPSRATEGAVGYDLCFDSEEPVQILPGEFKVMNTGIAITCPAKTYGRIAPRSGLTVKSSLTTLAGVIDPDYTGEVKVILHNFGQEPQEIAPQQKIAQLILENVATPSTKIVESLAETLRGNNGFGSTDNNNKKIESPTEPQIHIPITDATTNVKERTTAAAATLKGDLHMSFQPTTTIQLSHDPYDNHTFRSIDIRPSDKHPTLGLNIDICKNRDLPLLIGIEKGTSATRIKRWKSELRNGYITHVNDIPVRNIDEIKTHIAKAKDNKEKSVKVGFSTINKQAIHPQLGIPQMYHDQMNIIASHLWDIKNSPEWNKSTQEEIVYPLDNDKEKKINNINNKKLNKNCQWSKYKNMIKWYKIGSIKKRKKLTRRWLKQQEDWADWKASEFKQLDQYKAQGTLLEPTSLPKGSNLLPLLWTYLIKDCGTKKARCVCNGSPKMKGTVTMGNTYASSLDQTGSRIFWAATAINNYITIGADVSNAFAEAPPPKAPLYVKIDEPYREWYADRFPDKPPIPPNHVLPVKGALQGHPESPRLWAELIDKILQNLNLKPCSHEPCLYYTNNFNNTGKTVLFLRQVDDFAISCEDKTTAQSVIDIINSKMTVDIKELGTIERFNGVDVLQTKHFIKLYNNTYINKILQRHDWIHQENITPLHNLPLPMKSDTQYQRNLEQQPIPTEKEIIQLEKEMGFGYRQAIGELIYALVTCRPDISYPVIKLSQYSTRPTRAHFEAVKDVYRYLKATEKDGIHFWRKEPRLDLPYHPPPTLNNDNNYNEEDIHERQQKHHKIMFGAVDSDYGGDTEHRKSVTGIILRMAGGTILYKTKFQDTLALSSTEAEFTAAVEAGKYILYVRSILDEIGIPQDYATVLYEDNQGALLMANAQQPTKRTRHMDIKNFALQDWVKNDLIELVRISTNDNYSDVMTKATGRVLFYRHMNYVMGKILPKYIQDSTFSKNTHKSLNSKLKDVESKGG